MPYRKNHARLADLCGINTGLTVRGKLEAASAGGIRAAQMRDVVPGEDLSIDALPSFNLDLPPEKYLIEGGEVLFRSRGETNTASVAATSLTGPAAVTLPLIILRTDKNRLLPHYLAWAINHPRAQQFLGAAAQGQTIRMIPKSALEQLEIPLPDLETQHRIVAAHELARREVHLLRRLADRREQLASLLLDQRAQLASQQG